MTIVLHPVSGCYWTVTPFTPPTNSHTLIFEGASVWPIYH
jgi:hypothetical protein